MHLGDCLLTITVREAQNALVRVRDTVGTADRFVHLGAHERAIVSIGGRSCNGTEYEAKGKLHLGCDWEGGELFANCRMVKLGRS